MLMLRLSIVDVTNLLRTSLDVTIGTEEYSLAQKYVFNLIKPGYLFQSHSHHQAYLQSPVELSACVVRAATLTAVFP
jgi:hypothetical protein